MAKVGQPTDKLVQVDTFMRKPIFSVLDAKGVPRFSKFDLPRADRPHLRRWIFAELKRLGATPEQFYEKLYTHGRVIDYALIALENDHNTVNSKAVANVLSSLTIPDSKPWKPFSFGRLKAAMFPAGRQPAEVAALVAATSQQLQVAPAYQLPVTNTKITTTSARDKLNLQRAIWNRCSARPAPTKASPTGMS